MITKQEIEDLKPGDKVYFPNGNSKIIKKILRDFCVVKVWYLSQNNPFILADTKPWLSVTPPLPK